MKNIKKEKHVHFSGYTNFKTNKKIRKTPYRLPFSIGGKKTAKNHLHSHSHRTMKNIPF
jgi:hypothetical protein